MKIAIPSDLLAHHSLTGVEKYLYHLVHSLASSTRIDLTLLSQSNIPKERLPARSHYKKIKSYKFANSIYFYSALCDQQHSLPYDLIHCPTVIVPFFVLPHKKIKKIMTVHDLVPALFPELSNIKKYIYYKYILKFIFSQTDHIIVPSKSVERDLLNLFYIKPDRVTIIHEGVSSRFRPGSNQKRDFILAVSTVEPRKNFKRVIEAYIHLKKKNHIPEKLLIVGKRGWSCDDIYKIPNEFKDSILFKGYVPESDLIDLYQNAKLFIYPSLYEGFGLPVAEAMACGCPVITSNLSSLPEVAGKACLLVDPYDVGNIENAMLKILRDDRLACSLAEKGLERAKQFTWAKCAQETIKIYETVLNR